MTAARIGLSLLLLLAAVSESLARSRMMEVTPGNIGSLDRPLSLDCHDQGDGTVRFRLAVPSGQVSRERSCTLLLFREPVDLSPMYDSTLVNGELKLYRLGARKHPVLATCRLFEQIEADTLCYEAIIDRTALDRAAIMFVEYGRSFADEYSFSLNKFGLGK